MKEVISWFEIPSLDFDRACKFYNSVFEIELEPCDLLDMKMGIFPETDEGSTGAVVFGPESKPAKPGVMIYLSGGDDLSHVLNRVVSAGGKVIKAKTMIPEEMGFYAIFQDSEGNYIGLHSPD
jgi:uncharacterized protein